MLQQRFFNIIAIMYTVIINGATRVFYMIVIMYMYIRYNL